MGDIFSQSDMAERQMQARIAALTAASRLPATDPQFIMNAAALYLGWIENGPQPSAPVPVPSPGSIYQR